MDKNNFNVNPLYALVAVFGSVVLFRFLRNTTKSANNATKDLTNSKKQAADFFSYFGIVKEGAIAVATPVVLTSTKDNIALLAKNIDNWEVVQDTFTTLCGGNYTIFQAAKTALNTTDYTGFSNLIAKALTQKRIFCKDDYQSFRIYNRYVVEAAESFNKGAFVGRCQSEDDDYYYYISRTDGNTYACDKDYFFTTN